MKTYWNYDVLYSHTANLFIHGGEEHICWTKREYKQKNRSKERLFQEYGWGNRTRTYEWRDQNPLPYQLGYTPILVRKERLELSRREALEPKSSVSTNSTTSAKSGVDDGTWTHDNRNHNPGLYQLSYAHHSNPVQSYVWIDKHISAYRAVRILHSYSVVKVDSYPSPQMIYHSWLEVFTESKKA